MARKRKTNLMFLVFLCLSFMFLVTEHSPPSDTLGLSQSISFNQTLVSSGQSFELGFFTPENTGLQYLGIWYKNIPVRTVVWVANRDIPVSDSTGTLTLDDSGNLILVNQSGFVFWSANSTNPSKNRVAQLLDSGNFVLRDSGEGGGETDYGFRWQSFDHPYSTLLPEMKLGFDRKTGLNRFLHSWKSDDDPSPGDYTFGVDRRGLPQLVLRQQSVTQYRSGPWYDTHFSGLAVLTQNRVFKPAFVLTKDEMYYSYQVTENIISRTVLSPSGIVKQMSWNERHKTWYLLFTVRQDQCDVYAKCGPNGLCSITGSPICACLKGFAPKSITDWEVFDWSGGCVRTDPLVCGGEEGYVKYTGLKLPDHSNFRINASSEDCEAKCSNNCSCMAYTKLDVPGSGNGCVAWSGNLIDIREAHDYGHDLYVKMPASFLASDAAKSKKQKTIKATIIAISALFCVVASTGLFSIWMRRHRRKAEQLEIQGRISRDESREAELELPLFDRATIEAATSNFSATNKIGEGGFGPVYRGELSSRQEIAVKRRAENSGQGLHEFKNEVLLISKLQHRNLVKLLGCCIEGEDRMLIYEYMPNKSLDSLIFDKIKRRLLSWKKRLEIIIGIARGLLYLHRDSRLRIIHRDLKASNVLLDSDFNPKISDFGMARMFGVDQTEANTKRVVGTYGYMPPEYAIDGKFSLKSDVFSFGVMLLEIVSGKKNRGFFHPKHKLNLLGHAWKLWNEGKALELVDELLENQFLESEAIRCTQVGLLCVQQNPNDRPLMQSVLLMLDSDTVSIPLPGCPGFYAERCLVDTDSSSRGQLVSNEMTVTLWEGR